MTGAGERVAVEALVLASASPRRREMLTTLGVAHEAHAMDVDETKADWETPSEYGRRIALAKVDAGVAQFGLRRWVLAADTVVDVEGVCFGKPENDADATRMLGVLADRAHQVRTAVALARGSSRKVIEVVTDVRFGPLDAGAIARYVASGEGRDKAGAYAIQGLGGALVVSIDGSPSNVVGLPAMETVALIVEAGAIPCWPLPTSAP